MSDLISRSKLIEALEQDKKSICSHVYASIPCCDADNLEFELEYLIICQPTVEAKPVVNGEWIKNGSWGKCSKCGNIVSYNRITSFCCDCGADMRGGKNE